MTTIMYHITNERGYRRQLLQVAAHCNMADEFLSNVACSLLKGAARFTVCSVCLNYACEAEDALNPFIADTIESPLGHCIVCNLTTLCEENDND